MNVLGEHDRQGEYSSTATAGSRSRRPSPLTVLAALLVGLFAMGASSCPKKQTVNNPLPIQRALDESETPDPALAALALEGAAIDAEIAEAQQLRSERRALEQQIKDDEGAAAFLGLSAGSGASGRETGVDAGAAFAKEGSAAWNKMKLATYPSEADITKKIKQLKRQRDGINKVAAKLRPGRTAGLNAARTGSGRPACFIAGTPVHTPSGPRPIETIAVGDEVLSYNERNRRIEARPVTGILVGERHDLIDIDTPAGRLTCSANHSFYTSTATWAKAEDLPARSTLVSIAPSGETIVPAEVALAARNLATPVPVYNIGVAGNHNYFSGPGAILCHNTPKGGGGGGGMKGVPRK